MNLIKRNFSIRYSTFFPFFFALFNGGGGDGGGLLQIRLANFVYIQSTSTTDIVKPLQFI